MQDEADALRFETPTSSGKANALDIRSKSTNEEEGEEGFWILLTDDDKAADDVGAVRVLEWDGWGSDLGLRVVAEWPGRGAGEEDIGGVGEGSDEDSDRVEFTGASHAIWLD